MRSYSYSVKQDKTGEYNIQLNEMKVQRPEQENHTSQEYLDWKDLKMAKTGVLRAMNVKMAMMRLLNLIPELQE